MSVTEANILVGFGRLELDGVDVGATFGGVEISKTTDFHFKAVDQVLDEVGAVPTKCEMTIKTSLAEATLENFKKASIVAGPPRKLPLGIDTKVIEHTLVFIGTAPTGFNREYHVYRAIAFGASAHSLKKDDKVVIPVSFRILPDLSKTSGEEYGFIQDNVA
jgi:hypothetical protein